MPFMASLFGDADTDVRILATELARNMPAEDATRVLCGLLEHEQHPNVCAAAIDVLAEVGTRDAIPFLQACAKRFSCTPFVPYAASIVIARISNTRD
jgi:HEAT repeat protein